MLGNLHQPTTLILGLGESGLAMAHWCATYGGAVRIADTRAKPDTEKQQKLTELRATSGKRNRMHLWGIYSCSARWC